MPPPQKSTQTRTHTRTHTATIPKWTPPFEFELEFGISEFEFGRLPVSESPWELGPWLIRSPYPYPRSVVGA
jgi:hypothetical protein